MTPNTPDPSPDSAPVRDSDVSLGSPASYHLHVPSPPSPLPPLPPLNMSGQNTPLPGNPNLQQQAGPSQTAQPGQPPVVDSVAAALIRMADAITRQSDTINALTATMQAFALQSAQAPAPTVNATVNANREIAFVEKPASFRGKGSDAARLFRAAFKIYAKGQKERYGQRDQLNNLIRNANHEVMVDGQKYILGALSFMQDDTAEWARQYIEQASEGTILFTGSRTVFWDAFKSRFELQDEKAEALIKLQACTQGNRRFAEFFAEFQSLASPTSQRH